MSTPFALIDILVKLLHNYEEIKDTKAYGLHSLPVTGNVMIYMYNVSEQTELWPTDVSLRHSRNRAKCITYRVCFFLLIRASACPCLSSSSC